MKYIAPNWLPGGNLQTIWPALVSVRSLMQTRPTTYQRVRWTTPDSDFVDVDYAYNGEDMPTIGLDDTPPDPKRKKRPLLALFHGLEGSSASHYALAFAEVARQYGWDYAVPHFRGCSGEINRAPRAYHSGDYEEIGWMLGQLQAAHAQAGGGPLLAVGISLGGNALMRWAQEAGDSASRVVAAVAAVCSPLDLTASGHAIGQGFNRLIYTRMFLNTMKPKAIARLHLNPGLFDGKALLASQDLYAFDNVFTAPLHGFKNTEDYWQRASAKPHMQCIKLPALALNAINDPFIPAYSLPRAGEVGRYVTLWHTAHGGHVGYPQGRFPANVLAMPEAVTAWLAGHIQSSPPTR
ncbi:MAG: alpha/beta fold hydrolase [Undibacterium sp.]|uniref:YheT family hydrolase n=1 Tax=Undibacterium sp. TaxID=1914977 RepID=UPI002716D4A1|nr:alpha/beta fold hydrolase [Undibacterium sp.]MDO8651657.1 alpha/beta fold hydrolase [Undibacterium sp.]